MGRVPNITDWRSPKSVRWKESKICCNYEFLAVWFPNQNLGADQTQ